MRIKSLDGLRGIAVFIVILFHLVNNSYQSSKLDNLNHIEIFIMKITYFGWAGVNLFFVLSGFLIGTILISHKHANNYFKVFYSRRFLRILPVYLFFIVVYLVFKYFLFNESLILFQKPIPITAYFLLVQNFFMSNLGSFGPNALTPTWSLAVEEQFYLIIPVIIYFTNRKQLIAIAIFCIFFAQYHRICASNWYQEYTHFLSRMDAPFLGILLAIGREDKTNAFSFFKQWYTKLVLFLLLILLYWYNHSFNHLLISFVFLLILDWSIDLDENSFFYGFLTRKWILLVGKYSFFIYLFHQLLNGIMFAIFQNNSNPNLDSAYSYFLEILSFGLTFFLAHVSFVFFESKLINFGHTIRYNNNSN